MFTPLTPALSEVPRTLLGETMTETPKPRIGVEPQGFPVFGPLFMIPHGNHKQILFLTPLTSISSPNIFTNIPVQTVRSVGLRTRR